MSMDIRFPAVSGRLGLGVGMDLPWGQKIGLVRDPAGGDRLSPRAAAFLARHGEAFSYLVFSYQPKDRNNLRAESYVEAYDSIKAAAGGVGVFAFHQTLLNTGTPEPYDPTEIAAFTNALVERYGFKWIVEDIGIWSIAGKPLPYPLPPLLTRAGLEACVANIARWQRLLGAPLCVEFPGFTEGATFFIGELDAFEFFGEVARRTGSPVTLDIGHVLSYQWLRGRTGARLTEGLEALPLAHAFEFHLSGCQISGGKFRDLHHGVLLDEQLALLEYLLPRCPNARAITYEDPQYSAEGELIRKAVPNYLRLSAIAREWTHA